MIRDPSASSKRKWHKRLIASRFGGCGLRSEPILSHIHHAGVELDQMAVAIQFPLVHQARSIQPLPSRTTARNLEATALPGLDTRVDHALQADEGGTLFPLRRPTTHSNQ